MTRSEKAPILRRFREKDVDPTSMIPNYLIEDLKLLARLSS
jgi:hypothetical protein